MRSERLALRRCQYSCPLQTMITSSTTVGPSARHNHQSQVLQSLPDHHTVAAVSIAGTCSMLLGSLYLAYDLLGEQHGPLRLLTHAITYSPVFGIGYGLGLGPFFGLAAGIA